MEQIDSPSGPNEYRGALATARYAKNLFLWLIFLAIVIQLSAFVMVRFAKVFGPLAAGASAATATAPATAPSTQAAPANTAAAETWQEVYLWALPITKFVALAAGMLLVLTLLLSVKIALVGRTGGVAGFLGAFFWSLLLWVFLIPWQQVLPGSNMLAGVAYNLGDLLDATAEATTERAGGLTVVLYYARFLGYPIFVFILWLLVQRKYVRGYRQACLRVAPVEVEGPSDDEQGKL